MLAAHRWKLCFRRLKFLTERLLPQARTNSIAQLITIRKAAFDMIKIARSISLAAALFAFTSCVTAPKSQTLANGKSHFVSYGTNKVHYVTVGRGRQTPGFVYCLGGNLDFWRAQVPAFADQARLILIDLPGHGQSDKPHTAYTMDFFAGAVLAVMNDAHVDKAVLIGHSMGGPVICSVYKQAPEKVTA